MDLAFALARRNCELTERLGDVFSKSLALANLGASQLAGEEYADALDSIEQAERLYREAMDSGGEMETWRASIRAQALLGLGQIDAAVELSQWASETARARGMLWSLPLALHVLAQARAAGGLEGADEAFAEAAEVAERTGALLSLETIEEARGELGARAT